MHQPGSAAKRFSSLDIVNSLGSDGVEAPRLRTRLQGVVHQLQTRILEGDLQPGEELRVADLAKSFDTSSATIRDALLLLDSRHLVDLREGRTSVVATPTPDWFVAIAAEASGLSAIATDLGIARASELEVAEFVRRAEAARDLWGAEAPDQPRGKQAIWGLMDYLATVSGNKYLAELHHEKFVGLAFGVRHLTTPRNSKMLISTIDALTTAVETGDSLEGADIARDLYTFIASGFTEHYSR